jgi:hypothetical protein
MSVLSDDTLFACVYLYHKGMWHLKVPRIMPHLNNARNYQQYRNKSSPDGVSTLTRWGFESFCDPGSYAGGSVATGRVTQARQVKG